MVISSRLLFSHRKIYGRGGGKSLGFPQQDSRGRDPLMVALVEGLVENCRILLMAQADPRLQERVEVKKIRTEERRHRNGGGDKETFSLPSEGARTPTLGAERADDYHHTTLHLSATHHSTTPHEIAPNRRSTTHHGTGVMMWGAMVSGCCYGEWVLLW